MNEKLLNLFSCDRIKIIQDTMSIVDCLIYCVNRFEMR